MPQDNIPSEADRIKRRKKKLLLLLLGVAVGTGVAHAADKKWGILSNPNVRRDIKWFTRDKFNGMLRGVGLGRDTSQTDKSWDDLMGEISKKDGSWAGPASEISRRVDKGWLDLPKEYIDSTRRLK